MERSARKYYKVTPSGGFGRPFVPLRDRVGSTTRGHEHRTLAVHGAPTHFGNGNGNGHTRVVGDYGRYSQVRPGAGCGLASEKKYHDVDLDDAVVSSNVAVTPTVCIIPQGTSATKRVGRKCCIKNIAWRFEISLAVATAQSTATDVLTDDTVRVMMFLDSQCNGLAAPGSGVTGILEADDYQSFNNLSNKGRFRVLFDRFYAISRDAIDVALVPSTDAKTWDGAEVTITDSFYKKCDIPIEWDTNNTDGALTSIRSNNIGVLLISRTGSAKFVSKIRLRFED